MIISIALIVAVAIFHVSPWALLLLLITWIPDIVLGVILLGIVEGAFDA